MLNQFLEKSFVSFINTKILEQSFSTKKKLIQYFRWPFIFVIQNRTKMSKNYFKLQKVYCFQLCTKKQLTENKNTLKYYISFYIFVSSNSKLFIFLLVIIRYKNQLTIRNTFRIWCIALLFCSCLSFFLDSTCIFNNKLACLCLPCVFVDTLRIGGQKNYKAKIASRRNIDYEFFYLMSANNTYIQSGCC